ncbi:MAG: dephospho-CoA kinase [Saprospiraceae bacterium]|nr:dephospho-CoA kinase [Saprospiraceae bacterium]MCF8248612.1 dephospho-CoA kinase [Saprospiraceae bacterium]MCF8281050.1 dephospho-CoA kinase [Bacteroidales bacterium]MCF8310345.1 dephospho-CoA kinase [Saprospiraceae bacterium]MCF8442074.1 dephospho-CoA kinase [Saprospiraceae bacterium]
MSQISQTLPKAKIPLQVGVTGGIGSGKTTVCKIFEQLGIPVYYADERAKALMVANRGLIAKVKKLFGEAAYLPQGGLNRKWIGSIVFQDAKKLEQLNAIVHPAVFSDGEKWHAKQRNTPYTIKESALLFEIGSQIFYDKTIVVFAPKEIRLKRTILRDGSTRDAVIARMDKQMDDEKKVQLADFVIINDGKKMLIPQVLLIHKQLVEAYLASS